MFCEQVSASEGHTPDSCSSVAKAESNHGITEYVWLAWESNTVLSSQFSSLVVLAGEINVIATLYIHVRGILFKSKIRFLPWYHLVRYHVFETRKNSVSSTSLSNLNMPCQLLTRDAAVPAHRNDRTAETQGTQGRKVLHHCRISGLLCSFSTYYCVYRCSSMTSFFACLLPRPPSLTRLVLVRDTHASGLMVGVHADVVPLRYPSS